MFSHLLLFSFPISGMAWQERVLSRQAHASNDANSEKEVGPSSVTVTASNNRHRHNGRSFLANLVRFSAHKAFSSPPLLFFLFLFLLPLLLLLLVLTSPHLLPLVSARAFLYRFIVSVTHSRPPPPPLTDCPFSRQLRQPSSAHYAGFHVLGGPNGRHRSAVRECSSGLRIA